MSFEHALRELVPVRLSESDADNLKLTVSLINSNYQAPRSYSRDKAPRSLCTVPKQSILKSKREDNHWEGYNNKRVKCAASMPDNDDKPLSW